MLAISDTGVGMDNETQSRIFEPFFTTKGAKGTGLGLSTVYGIVKQSGGFIFVDSQPQRGTAFRAYFPRVDGREDAAAAQDSVGLPRAERGQETILLVEDEANLRRLARQYLETQGYKILEAEDGAAALQIVDGYQGTIDLLLTDVIMPGMNGRELAAQVTKLLPDIRVLYMSGYTENAIGHDGTLDAGINLLQKPFSLPALKDRVREVAGFRAHSPGGCDGIPAGSGTLRKRRFRRSGRAVSISICRCAIVRWEKRAGVPARRKTSAALDCCFRRRNCCIRMRCWRLASCCRRKLRGSRPRK